MTFHEASGAVSNRLRSIGASIDASIETSVRGLRIGVPVVASVLGTWFVVQLRGRRARAHEELDLEGAYLDDGDDESSLGSHRELDEATAELLG